MQKREQSESRSFTRGEIQVWTKIIISSVFLTLTAGVVAAASYCAVFAWGKSCDYPTLEDCLRAAGTEGGCEANPKDDEAPPPGTAPFCLVTPYRKKCIYENEDTCSMEASMEHSVFIQYDNHVECSKYHNII